MQVPFGYFCVLNKKMIIQPRAAATAASVVDLAWLGESRAGRAGWGAALAVLLLRGPRPGASHRRLLLALMTRARSPALRTFVLLDAVRFC